MSYYDVKSEVRALYLVIREFSGPAVMAGIGPRLEPFLQKAYDAGRRVGQCGRNKHYMGSGEYNHPLLPYRRGTFVYGRCETCGWEFPGYTCNPKCVACLVKESLNQAVNEESSVPPKED